MNQGFVGWSAPHGASAYVKIEDQKTSATDGGTFTSGSYQTRTLTTVVSDASGICLLDTSTSRVRLPAGHYYTRISCPALQVNNHKARLQNITAGTSLLLGTVEFAVSTSAVQTRSFIAGSFDLAQTSLLEVQHQCTSTKTGAGFGTGGSFSVADTEVYTVAEFWRLA